MATLNELVFGVLSSVAPYASEDTRFTYEKVAYDIKNSRAVLIRNELNKNRSIDPAIIQSLGCVPVKAVDEAECCSVTTGCYIMRTVEKIPNTIETYNKKLVTRIGPIKLTEKGYNIVSYNQAQYSGNGEYTKKEVYAFIHNGYVYLKSKNPDIYQLKYINIQGIFENPEDLTAYQCSETDETPCYNEDSSYPLNAWMIGYIENLLYEKYAKMLQIPDDKSNDATDKVTDK